MTQPGFEVVVFCEKEKESWTIVTMKHFLLEETSQVTSLPRHGAPRPEGHLFT